MTDSFRLPDYVAPVVAPADEAFPKYVDGSVRAHCPECGTLTTFESRNSRGEHGTIVRDGTHFLNGVAYTRVLYIAMRCAGCGRGGLATVHDHGRVVDGKLETFYPASIERAALPTGTPAGVASEFREAEICASVQAWRAASALLRSALEKTLIANGYAKDSLAARIDQAANDGILTAARQRRAHDDVRVLGNDILHDEWRAVTRDEYNAAHHYTQRIMEDFYDHRSETEAVLQAAGRLPKT